MEANQEVRKQFLNCMKALLDFPDEVVRGEAYYCLGELKEESLPIDEDFLAEGLYDDSYFVKACCANVLHHYIPLKETILHVLKNELSMCEPNEKDIYQKKLYYYAKKTLKSHYDYIKIII